MVDNVRKEKDYLADILSYAHRARRYVQVIHFNREKFASSSLHQDAIIRCIEVIGEASKNISSDTKNALPQISWQEMAGMRNRLVHIYFDVVLDVVWETVIEDLPSLINILESFLSTTARPAR